MTQMDMRFRLFRLTLLGAGILLLLQYIFGMLINLYVQFPNALPNGNAWAWVFTKSILTQVHAYLGTLLLVIALVALLLGVLVRSFPGITASIIGLSMTVFAYLSGIWFLTYGQQSVSSLWMALGFIGALLAYTYGYYVTRQVHDVPSNERV